jgi:uncharacterized membrane protein
MAQTATRRRNGGAPRRPGPAKAKARRGPAAVKGPPAAARRGAVADAKGGPAHAAKRAPARAKKGAGKATDAVSTPSIPKPNPLVRKLAAKVIKKLAKKLASRALESGAELVRAAADKAAATPSEVVEAVEKGARRRLPIQRSLDIAVPLQVAWEEWLALESLPEGVDTVADIERDGEVLVGRITGPRARDWEAEILDEREQQSFAWLSHEGSDCSGLITFHELSLRLTRVELNLDVVPTGIADAVQLKTHLADRHAEAELRRFKSRVELINPDEYEDKVEAARHAKEAEAEPADESNRDRRENNRDQPQDDTDELDEAA